MSSQIKLLEITQGKFKAHIKEGDISFSEFIEERRTWIPAELTEMTLSDMRDYSNILDEALTRHDELWPNA